MRMSVLRGRCSPRYGYGSTDQLARRSTIACGGGRKRGHTWPRAPLRPPSGVTLWVTTPARDRPHCGRRRASDRSLLSRAGAADRRGRTFVFRQLAPARPRPGAAPARKGGAVLGDRLGESAGKFTGVRVLPTEGGQIKIEV